MIEIRNADLCSKDYREFKRCILEEWGEVNQLPECDEVLTLPSPLLVFEDKHLAGGLTFIDYMSPYNSSIALWINTVYIIKLNRGMGIASQLINKATKVTMDYGASELFVYTNKKGLYLKIGWQIVSEDEENCVLRNSLTINQKNNPIQ